MQVVYMYTKPTWRVKLVKPDGRTNGRLRDGLGHLASKTTVCTAQEHVYYGPDVLRIAMYRKSRREEEEGYLLPFGRQGRQDGH